MQEQIIVDSDWDYRLREQATMLIRYMMLTKGVSYVELSEKLAKKGVHVTPRNLSNKVRRGNFGVVTLLQIMEVLEIDNISLLEKK